MEIILVEGASTAYGMDAGEYGGWAAQLHRDRQEHNAHNRINPQVVKNLSLPGLTLPYFNRTYEAGTSRTIRASKRALRILAIGINETKIHEGSKRPVLHLGQFARKLAKYSEFSQRDSAHVIYVGSNPVDESRTLPVPLTGARIEDDLLEEYDGLVRQQAEADGMPYIDMRSTFIEHGLETVLAPDGYHPNEAGHRLIHTALQPALAELGFAVAD